MESCLFLGYYEICEGLAEPLERLSEHRSALTFAFDREVSGIAGFMQQGDAALDVGSIDPITHGTMREGDAGLTAACDGGERFADILDVDVCDLVAETLTKHHQLHPPKTQCGEGQPAIAWLVRGGRIA